MKILCIVLGSLVILLSGVVAYSTQFVLKADERAERASKLKDEAIALLEAEPEMPASQLLLSPQLGLADELLESLKKANGDLDERKLALDKRERELDTLYQTYLALQKEIMVLLGELETGLVGVSEGEVKNFKRLAGIYSKMSSEAAAQSLKHMEPERVAQILCLMEPRAMAGVMDESVNATAEGSELVAEWSEAIRLMGRDKE
jgi:flagellar motility protein MotE (MotC chaperone)